MENIKTVNSIKYIVVQEEKIPFIDAAGLFDSLPGLAARDSRHPDSKGNKMIALKIYEQILKENRKGGL